MLKSIISFISKMFIVSAILMCFYQFASMLSGQSQILHSVLLLAAGVYSINAFIKLDKYICRKKPLKVSSLRVIKSESPLRSA